MSFSNFFFSRNSQFLTVATLFLQSHKKLSDTILYVNLLQVYSNCLWQNPKLDRHSTTMAPKTPKAHGILPVLAHFQFTNFIRTGTVWGQWPRRLKIDTAHFWKKIFFERSSEASTMHVWQKKFWSNSNRGRVTKNELSYRVIELFNSRVTLSGLYFLHDSLLARKFYFPVCFNHQAG